MVSGNVAALAGAEMREPLEPKQVLRVSVNPREVNFHTGLAGLVDSGRRLPIGVGASGPRDLL